MGTKVSGRRMSRAVCCGLLGMMTAVGADGISGQAAAQQSAGPGGDLFVAQADAASHDFDIAPQSLTGALAEFGRQSGMQVSVDAGLIRGIDSPGVRGTLAAGTALKLLLVGTGMIYRLSDDNTVMLERVPAGTSESGSTLLDPIVVEGTVETATGPVDGYVARRSATGSKTDTPINEIPQSVSVVTADEIETRGAETVGEALSYTAGVTTGTRGDSSGLGGDNIALRGFGGDGTAGGSSNEYWDGLKMDGTNYATSSLDPYLLERVEVLRGPSSVLYGQNQPGGVVNRVSKRPPDSWQGEVQAKGGTFDTYEFGFDLGGAVTEDKSLAFRAVGVFSDGDAQTDFTGKRRVAAAPSVTWRPSDDTTFTLLTAYQHDDIDGGFVKYVPAAGSVSSNPNGDIARERFTGDPNYDKWDRTLYSVGYNFEHHFDDTWTLRQNARYFRNELDLEAIYLKGLQADQRTIDRSAFGAVETSDAYTIDTQIQADVATGPVDHTLLFGIDLRRRESDTLRRSADAPTLDLYDPVYYQNIPEPPIYQSLDSVQNWGGVYLQDQVKLDNWILTLSGRHDWTDSKTTNRLTDVTSQTNERAVTGRVGLGYAFDFGLTPYVSYAESFEPTSGVDFSGNSFEPTTGKQVEAGVKYEPEGYDAFLTLAVFNLAQQNVLTKDVDNPGFSVQRGEVRSRGVEIEGVANLVEGVSARASYTFLDQEVTKSNDGNAGNRLTGIPQHSAALWGDYTFSDGNLEGLRLGAGVRYVGSTMGDDANTFKVPAVTLFDAALSYELAAIDRRLDGVKLAVNARNLFDKEYVASCISEVRCYYGVGRTVMATLKFAW
mgnify:CR=1 FL=1